MVFLSQNQKKNSIFENHSALNEPMNLQVVRYLFSKILSNLVQFINEWNIILKFWFDNDWI